MTEKKEIPKWGYGLIFIFMLAVYFIAFEFVAPPICEQTIDREEYYKTSNITIESHCDRLKLFSRTLKGTGIT